MDILTKLFGSDALVKLLRLFVNYPEKAFETKELVSRCRITAATARREIAVLKSMDFVSLKEFTVTSERGGKTINRMAKGYQLNRDFELLRPLKSLLFHSEPIKEKDVLNKFKGIGNLKCLIISGIFTQNEESRVDLLLVGDGLRKSSIENVIRGIEAEMGKELEYAIFTTPEFKYRMEMYDKFVYDILEYPHMKVLDKLGV